MTIRRSTAAPSAVIACVIILLSVVLITVGITYATEPSELPDPGIQSEASADASDSGAGPSDDSSQPPSDSSAGEGSTVNPPEESSDTSSAPELGQSIPAMSAGTFNSVGTQYCILYDVTHDAILYSKNSAERAYPASVTKLLTAAVASEYCQLDTPFTVGDEQDFVQEGSSLAYLQRGQRLTFEGLLDAMLLPSGNDAAYTMACGVGRIVANDPTLPAADAVALFVELMNEKARELGCRDSHFANPDGFHHDDHYTTAYDMARIAVACMEIEPVAKSCSKTVGRAVFLSGEDVTWYSTNKLLGSYRYATGLKTGLDGRGRPLSCRFGGKGRDAACGDSVPIGRRLFALRRCDHAFHGRLCLCRNLFAERRVAVRQMRRLSEEPYFLNNKKGAAAVDAAGSAFFSL